MIHQLRSQDPAAPALRSLLLILRTPSPGASQQLHLQSRSRVPSLLSISRTTAGSRACRLPPGRPHRLRTALCPPTLSPEVARCDLHRRKTVCSSWAWASPGFFHLQLRTKSEHLKPCPIKPGILRAPNHFLCCSPAIPPYSGTPVFALFLGPSPHPRASALLLRPSAGLPLSSLVTHLLVHRLTSQRHSLTPRLHHCA